MKIMYFVFFMTAVHMPGFCGDVTPKGEVVDGIACLVNPEQTYALYLPTQYTPDRSWPLVMVLDPMKRGRLAVDLFAAGAERWGYIVMGSNNSHNYDWSSTTQAVNAMWNDAATRFNINPKRVYHSGFSGGARASCDLALMTGKAAGVIAFGAAFSRSRPPSGLVPFSFVGVIGNSDMNYQELLQLDRRLDELKLPHKIIEFDGGHRWPSYQEPFTQALAWIELEAYRHQLKPRDEGLEALFEQALQGAAHLESERPYLAWQAYAAAVDDFDGLLKTKRARDRRNALADRKVVRKMARQRASIAKRELKRMRTYSDRMDQLRTFDPESQDTAKELAWWQQTINKQPHSDEDPQENLYAQRMLTYLRNGTWEVSMVALVQKDIPLAVFAGQVAITVGPKRIGSRYHLARAYAAAGERDSALTTLEQANKLGMRGSKRLLGTLLQRHGG